MEITFRQWLKQVDNEIEAFCGLSHSDLEDAPYSDWYEEGMRPREAAQEVLANEGFPF